MASYFPQDILVVDSSLLSTKTFAAAAVEKLGAYGLLSLKEASLLAPRTKYGVRTKTDKGNPHYRQGLF
jgi:hypothetical protein